MKNFNSFMWLRGYGLKRVGRILACLTLLLTLACGNMWGATYYVIPAKCNVSAGALVAGSDGSTQLFKTDESTVTVNTDISSSLTGTAGFYYNSTSTTYANLTKTSNYGTSSSSSRTMRGIKVEASAKCTITVNSKRFSKLDVIYRCASSDSGKTLTIDGQDCTPGDANTHLKSITKDYSSNIIISNGSNKEFDIFVILTEASGCTAPNHVDITGTNKYLGGQTISLTATAYSSAGTGSPIADANITGWQWQKEISSVWTNVENGEGISGATTNNLQISSCDHNNSGQYRCVVSTGATCSTNSGAYGVHVFTIYGHYYGGEYSHNEIAWTSGTTGTATIHLNASSTYIFKVWSNDGYYYGNGSGNYIIQPVDWDCGTDNSEMRLFTGPEGDYTFTVDIENALDNGTYVNVQVGYPSVEHPATGYVYLTKWWDCYPHFWDNSSNALTPNGYDPQITTYTTICGTDYWYMPALDNYTNVYFKDNATWGSASNHGDETSTSGNSGKYYTHDGVSWGWHSFTTYTITFAANGGSSTMSAISGICPDADQALTANAYTKTGYTFGGWKANVAVTIDGVSKAAGTVIDDEETLEDIASDITLTAQWTAKSCTVTFDIEGGSGTITDVTATYDAAMPSKASNLPTKTGYTFGGFFDGDNGTGTKYYNADGTSAKNWDKNTTSKTTLYALWTANTYTVTLDPDEGSSTSTATATYDAAMPSKLSDGETSIEAPSYSGYTFGGYYDDHAGAGNQYYTNTVASAANWNKTSNTTLYAKWTQSVTIDDNGGSADGSVSVTYNGMAGTPSVPTYAGHTVDLGYYAESSCTNKVMALDGTLQTSVTDGSSVVWTNSSSKWAHAGSSTLYAHWKCNTPEISCSSNTITISVPTGATVYYTTTTDGSTPADPTSSSTAYNPSSKPTISADTKIKAIAIQSGCTNSAIASASLTYVAPGTSYYLFTPTSAPNPVHTGTLKGDFITDKSVGDGTAQTIDGNEFSKKSITIAGSTLSGSISGKKAGNYSIDYDVKTTSTTFYVYVSGANTSIYMHKIRESGYTTDSIVSQSTGASTGVKLTFTLKSKENTRVCFSTGSTSVRCYQIVAVESGDALPQACDEGYELNFNSGRYAYLAGSSNQMTGSIDGLDICSYNSYQYKNSTALELTKNSSDTYISFTTGASACAVKVTFSAGTLILNTSKSTSGGVGLTSNTAANLSASTTYYIINTNTTNRASITKIAFEETAAATYTLTNTVSPSGYGTVSHASVSSIPSGTSTSSSSNTYTVNGTTVTATPAATTAEYTYAFDSWSDLPATVAADAIVTANFTRTANNYTLAWNTNGGSDLDCDGCTSGSTAYGASITAPNDPTLSNYTFDGWNTANDGSGSSAAATMPAANTTYYAAWKQTVTLTTGAQGEGGNQTPYVYLNGTGVSSFTPHTASGYTLQGYYTAGSGGTKVLKADGTFAGSNVTDYITSGKWSRTGAAPTLYAQWVAAEDCSTSDFVIKTGSSEQYQGCMESSSYNGTATSFTAGSATTVGNAKMTISSYSGGAITRPGNGNVFSIVIEPVSGYYLKSICWAGKVEDDETVSYYWDNNSGSAATITPQTTSGTGVTYDAPNSTTTKFTASYTDDGDGSGGIWWRNVQVEVCAGGGTTYNVAYDDNDATGGTAPTDATNYSYGGTVTVIGNTGSLVKTNYTFAGWSTNNDGTGSNYVADNTFSITGNTTLYAKWTQAVTFDANTANHGSTGGSATAVWNATGLTGITHATPASGYKLTGYYTAATAGTKVLNSDGTFADEDIDGYITDGKWSRTGAAATLYAQYESAGALTWNLVVKSDTSALSTSTKTSAFTEIAVANMTNAALTGLTYTKSSKSSLTGKISTPASYDADKYVYVTFQVASGYKFTPSMIQVPVQPVGDGEHKAVELRLTDTNTHSLVSGSATKCDGTEKGKKTTVTLAGDGTYFTGTVTLKIYVYDFSSSATGTYRLGTPITIEGEIDEACATMPSYSSMSYTTTSFLPDADASGSPITIVGGDNINTYQWKYNTVNDRTSGTNCGTGTSLTPLTDEDAATDGTRYYWCEMTNTSCGITIKSPAVAITVAAAKSNATVTWTDPASTPNYGGGGYTIKATVDQTGWDGNAADLVITAPAGINIYNVTSGTTSSQKWVQADFDVQTSFDRTTYASNIPFSVSAAATATYNAISNDHNTAYSACAGGGEGSSYNIRVRKSYDKDASNNYRWVTPGAGEITYAVGSSISSGKAGTAMATVFDSIMSSDKQYIWVKTFVDNIKQMRLYVETSGANVSVSALYQRTTYAAADAKDVITAYSVVYDEDDDAENTGTKGQHTIDLIFTSALSANDIICVKFSSSKVKALGAAITESSAGSLNTYLQWSGSLADKATVAKNTTDAYFTYSASKITENTNTLGAITYSSSNTSAATVDATGKVALVAAGETTIKATLAASGCYKKAEISYTLNVTEVPCAITAGTLTLTSGTETKCEDDEVTLTLTGFESGASIQWKDGDTDINNGGNYTIATDGTTSTLTTDQEGTYSVMVTSGCSVRSNRITISNKSTEVGAKRIVKNWYIKNGRQTPDIELWTLQNGAHLSSVAWSPDNATGLTASDFYESDGKVYLKGKEPSSNTSGADINYTLTLTVEDDCGSTTAMSASGQLIYLHHQKNTDKHVLAFVVNGTDKGGFTEGITAAQTTSVELYNTIAANFDVLATNVYSTDDEQALKEYYSQFDILCVTDYPNTGTKGVNKKSYVDALGALVDIRPILTMEAFVAKLANWKAKGISGTPQSPTTRQYTMLLQCKDHEIFSGTELTKVGEGDETMYRVSMVDNTLEDYVTLDATYGGGEHAEKSGYEYGSKPALQGFTFDATMADDGLLPLGLIDDGAGNDLQVGIERQAEMEARLMVLGINSYAMERLTDDGQTVVVNALKYLMKKNSEDIADCSNTFVGGDDEEDESTRYDWNVDSHWSGNAIPERTQKVRIVAPCVIKADEKFHVTGVVIAPSGKYNHGANTANGSLTIAAGGALIVDGKVEAATAPYFTNTRATSSSDLAIGASSTAQGALIFDNEDGETNATVEMYSASHWEVVEGKKKKYWSYVALPVQSGNVGEYFYNGFSYLYDETEGWIKKGMYAELHAFEGLGISMQTGNMEYFHGALAPTTTQEFTLTYTADKGEGENLIGNSWTAPIQIANFDASDFGSATATVYVYNTGRDDENEEDLYGGSGSTTAGQWISVPISSAKEGGYTGLKVIPAMNAFQVNTSSETTLTLDYDKLVRGGATSAAVGDLTVPLRAPKRSPAKAQNGIEAMMCVRMSGEKTHADVWLQQDERFSNSFDNGWEATYVECDNRSPQFYAQSEIGKMAFLALPDLEGTVLGLAPSRDGNEYSFTFHYVGEEEFYLNDLKLHDAVLINEENSYEFTYSEGDTNRFYISRTAINAPTVTTGVGNTRDGVKAQKILYNNKLYIIINGRVYSAEGALVK